jgi:hypothetical protein
MAAVPVKDQKSILANYTGLGVLVKYLFKPEQAQLIISLSILACYNHSPV